MRPFLWLAVFAAAFLVACTAIRPIGPISSPDVKVTTEDGHGSGTHIGDGYFLSAAHVVAGMEEITIKTDDGETREAEVLWLNTDFDVALIRVKDYSAIASANLSCRVPHIGEAITARGNPLGMEFFSVWGKIAGRQTEFGPWKSVVITDIATVPGQSGGGVYDQDGNLVGVTVGVALAHIGYSPSIVGLGYVVSGRIVCDLLARKA